MSSSIKHHFKLNDLKFEKNHQVIHAYFEFVGEEFHYVLRYHADVPNTFQDPASGWKREFCAQDMWYKKSAFSRVGIEWNSECNLWSVILEPQGLYASLYMYFKTETRAQAIFDILHEWLTESK